METYKEKIDLPEPYKDWVSEAKQRKSLFQKHKKVIGTEEKLADFKEPVALLIRNTGSAHIYENVTKGKFYFKHSDGEERFILITGNPFNVPYGRKTFRMYVLHENHALPLPENPLITTEAVANMLEQALVSSAKFKATEWRGRTNFAKMIVWGIIGIILAMILWYILVPSDNNTPTQIIIQNVTTIRDVTPTIV